MVVPTVITWGKIKAKLYAWLSLVITWGKIKAKLYAWYSLQSLPEVKLKLNCMHGCSYRCYLR
jgi:hypothetical protein